MVKENIGRDYCLSLHGQREYKKGYIVNPFMESFVAVIKLRYLIYWTDVVIMSSYDRNSNKQYRRNRKSILIEI